MTTTYQTLHNITPEFLIFSKDGNIRVNSVFNEVIGSWSKIGRGNKAFWSAGISYTGTVHGKTRTAVKYKLVELVSQRGLTVIESEK